MSDHDRASVALDWRRDWCADHLEPFRAEWPKGALVAMTRLFDAAVVHPDVLAAAGGDVSKLEAVFAEFGPLCCLVGDDVMAAIYTEAGV